MNYYIEENKGQYDSMYSNPNPHRKWLCMCKDTNRPFNSYNDKGLCEQSIKLYNRKYPNGFFNIKVYGMMNGW